MQLHFKYGLNGILVWYTLTVRTQNTQHVKWIRMPHDKMCIKTVLKAKYHEAVWTTRPITCSNRPDVHRMLIAKWSTRLWFCVYDRMYGIGN